MEENKIIKAILKHKAEDDTDVIELNFDNTIEINLSKNEQSNLREVFSNMLKNALTEKFNFELSIDDSSNNQIIIEIAEGYTKELNKELHNSYEEDIFRELYKKIED